MLYNRNSIGQQPKVLLVFLFKGVKQMAKSPAEVLKKTKITDRKGDKDDDSSKKAPRRSALLDFIAKHKKA